VKQAVERRLGTLKSAIDKAPIPSAVLKPAFETFRDEGVLPTNLHVARAVLRQCQTGLDASEEGGMDDATLICHLIHLDRPKDEIMDALYAEAVSDDSLVRDLARSAMQFLRYCGFDVTDPVFEKNGLITERPGFGSAGLWVLGFPGILVRPPYEEQAQRWIDRITELRQRVPRGSRRWIENLVTSVSEFRDRGVVPEDERILDYVLADLELCELIRNLRGASDPEMMLALDVAARAPRDSRAALVERVAMLAVRRNRPQAAGVTVHAEGP